MGANGLAAIQPSCLYLPQNGVAGNRVGVFSATNYAEDLTLGRGPELNVQHRIFGYYAWRSGTTNNQGIWRFGTGAATGWGIIEGNTRDVRLFCRPSTASTVLNTPRYLGPYHCVIRVVDATPTLRCSVNGGAAFNLALPAAYVPAGATAIHSIGKWQSEAAFPAVNTSILAQYVIDGYSGGVTTDADIEYLSGSPQQLDCWRARPIAYTHPNLVMMFDPNAWGGGAGSDYALAGSGGYVMRMQGTGGGKTTMPQYDKRRIPLKAIFGNAYNDYYENGVFRRSVFSFPTFQTNAIDIANGPSGLLYGVYGKNLGIVANAEVGLNAAGVNLAGNNIGIEMDTFDVNQLLAAPGIGAGTKTIINTEGIHSIVTATGEDKPNASPQYLIVPHTASIVWGDSYAAVANVTGFGFDSLLEELLGITDVGGVKGPPYDSAVMLQRLALAATRRVVCEGWGSGTWFERISSAALIDTYVRQWVKLLRGTSSNHCCIQLDSNDSFFNTYLLQTTFQTNLGSFINAMLSTSIPGLKIQLIGSTSYTGVGGSTPNASGWIVADFNASESAVVASIANPNVSYVNGIGWVSAGNKPDTKHYNPTGAAEWSTNKTANPPP
jgi:hypothetical protein